MARMTIGPILALWIATGAGIGAAMGVATDNIGTWLAVGIGIGAAVGTALGARHLSTGNDNEDENKTD